MEEVNENFGIDLKSVFSNIENGNNYVENIYSEDPLIVTVDNFVTEYECKHMIELGKPNLQQSVVSDNQGGHISAGRTSKTSWIDHFKDEITTSLANRISSFVKLPIKNAEKYQLVYYAETNEYKQHYDSWDHNGSEKTLRCIKYGGPRMITALVYLNKPEQGGSTRFTKLNIDVEPEIGKLLVFENTYKNSIDKHHNSEHAGMPVIKGEKYIFNLWFRQYDKSKLYSEFNPEYYGKLSNNVLKNENIVNNNESKTLTKTHKVKNIYKQDNFLSTEECSDLISECNFSDSKYPSAWLNKTKYPSIILKISSLLNIVPSFFENINIIKYKENQVHGPFNDAYDLYSDKGMQYTSKLGQRIKTISICLQNDIDYEFNKINLTIKCKQGTLVYYDNVLTTPQRDEDVIHRIINSDKGEGYLLNIYVREKDNQGNKNNIINLSKLPESIKPESIQTDVNKSNIITESINLSEKNHIDLYHNVLKLFETNKIDINWRGMDDFKYAFKGDFNYFKNCVLQFKNCIDNNKGLNRKLLEDNYHFDEYNPVNLNNIVHNDLLSILQEYYRTTITNKVWILGDKQSNRFKAHNEPLSRFLHYELLPLIEKITSKKLRPTYTYLSSYIKDCDLPAHTDREDCEYTVSFLVNKDMDWPIYLHKIKQSVPNKGRSGYNPPLEECIKLEGNIGGFIMFCGTDHLHFREIYNGEFYDILLLHYRVDLK